MSENVERNAKFQGFAELLATELKERGLLNIGNFMQPLRTPPVDLEFERIKLIIAKRAYDFAEHVLELPVTEYERKVGEMTCPQLCDIPDMAALPPL